MSFDPIEYLANLTKENFKTERLAQARTMLNLTQEIFSQQIGVAFSTYNAWETGKRVPSFEGISQLQNFARRHLADTRSRAGGEESQGTKAREDIPPITLDSEVEEAVRRLALATHDTPQRTIRKAVSLYERLVEDDLIAKLEKISAVQGHSVPGIISRTLRENLPVMPNTKSTVERSQ